MKTRQTLSFLILVFLLGIGCTEDSVFLEVPCTEKIENLKINQYQTLGSHNSYRKKTQAEIFAFVNASSELLPEGFDIRAWDYAHEPIEDQLNIYNLRSFELDVYRDPEGGLFYNRLGNLFVGLDPSSGEEKLQFPGLKVLHFPDFDYNTHFLTFVDALETLKFWSNSNPTHLPITILVEAKEDSPDDIVPELGLTSTFDFAGSAVEEIENEINEVFALDQSHIIKPDDVKGSNSNLRNAIMTTGWPRLATSRGKIMFVLMARDEVIDSYIDGNPSLQGRNMFVFTDPERDEAAFLNINDPEANLADIQTYVDQGFMVRTQADSNTEQARTGSYTRMNSAFESGAQIINTDYYRPDPRFAIDEEWTDYEVKFPNNNIALIHTKVMEFANIYCNVTE